MGQSTMRLKEINAIESAEEIEDEEERAREVLIQG